MTPEQKQIAIAEFDGISIEEYRMEEGCINTSALPPYLTSRDAICGVVARLDDGQKVKFANYLYDIYLGFNEDVGFHRDEMLLSAKSVANMVTSTPAQLSDALLLTLGYEL